MTVRVFGETEDGSAVREVTLSGGGLSATIMEWGCVTRALRLDGLDRPLTLGFGTLAEYVANGGQHLGAVAGRCANRIGGGRFEIDGVAYQAARNIGGQTTLHGGDGGFGRSLWRLEDHGRDHATFTIRHRDGEQGFPGAIEATCRYRVSDGALAMEMTATTDAPTLCNLAQHNYYNLSGADRIDDHVLEIAAERLTPLGADLVPTSALAAVGDVLDFRGGRRIGAQEIDLNFVLAEARRKTPEFAARLSVADVELTVETTEPGLQVYTADSLSQAPRAGVCLEAQLWPDAPNHEGFPSAILRPGETYRQETTIGLRRL